MILGKNPVLRKELLKRWKDLGLKPADIIRDARERGVKLYASQMSRYMKGEKGCPCEQDLLWLAWRWGVRVQMVVGRAVVKEGKITFEVPPYNEEECLASIKKLFGT